MEQEKRGSLPTQLVFSGVGSSLSHTCLRSRLGSFILPLGQPWRERTRQSIFIFAREGTIHLKGTKTVLSLPVNEIHLKGTKRWKQHGVPLKCYRCMEPGAKMRKKWKEAKDPQFWNSSFDMNVYQTGMQPSNPAYLQSDQIWGVMVMRCPII